MELLEKIEQFAPDYYVFDAGWFDVPRLRYAIANRQLQLVEPLLKNLKKEPDNHADHLKDAIDLLAWSGADEQLHNLVQLTYKEGNDSEKIWNPDFVNRWIYFEIYYNSAISMVSIEE